LAQNQLLPRFFRSCKNHAFITSLRFFTAITVIFAAAQPPLTQLLPTPKPAAAAGVFSSFNMSIKIRLTSIKKAISGLFPKQPFTMKTRNIFCPHQKGQDILLLYSDFFILQ